MNRMVGIRRRQVAICFFAFILIGANDGATGVLLPSLMAQYHVNKAQISLMFLAATAGYLIATFTSGLMVERLGRRIFLISGASTFALGALTLTLQPPFLLFLLSLVCSGAGVGVLDAGLNAYIASLPNNTAPLNYLHAFYGAGALLGPVVASGILAVGLGWNFTYLVWLVMALLALGGFAILLDGSSAWAASDGGRGGNVLAGILRLGLVWLTAGFLFFYVGAEVGLGTWGYSYLIEVRHGLPLLSAWSVSGYWLGLTLGRLVLGRFGSRLGNRRLIELCLGGVVIGVLLIWLVPVAIVSAMGLWLVGFSFGPIFPTAIALLSDRISPRLQPSAIGFVAVGGSVGAAFFPLLAGNLAQALGIWTLMPYVIMLTAFMLGAWLSLSRRGEQVEGQGFWGESSDAEIPD